MAKDTRIAFRASDDMKNRLKKVAETVRLSETTLAEACVEALIRYIEEHGEIRMPLSIVPTSELEKKGDAPSSVMEGRELPGRSRFTSSTAELPPPPDASRIMLNEGTQIGTPTVTRRTSYVKQRHSRISDQK